MSTFLYRKKREKPKLLLPIRIERLGKSAAPVPTVVLCSPHDGFFHGLNNVEEKPKDTLNSVAWMEGAMAILEPKKQTL